MELVTYDKETVTIRFRKEEYARLLAVLQTADADYTKLDSEMLNLSEPEVGKLTADIFALDDLIPRP